MTEEIDTTTRNRTKHILAVKVLPNVWLGDHRAAQNESFFQNENITAVLNATPNVPNLFKNNDSIEYMRIPVYDSFEKRDCNKMYQYFPVITEYIYKSTVIEKKNILVNCYAGRQRSAACIASYLIKYYSMTPIQAMEFLLKKKPDAFHWGKSVNFAKSLNKWYYMVNPEEKKKT